MTLPKLIRDRLPAIITVRTGKPPTTRRAAPDELDELLRAKLQEEAAEVATAISPEATIEELADVLEVVVALARRNGGMAAVMARQQSKFVERGGFDDGCVLLAWEEAPR